MYRILKNKPTPTTITIINAAVISFKCTDTNCPSAIPVRCSGAVT